MRLIYRLIGLGIIFALIFYHPIPAARAQLSCGQKLFSRLFTGCGGGIGTGGGGGACSNKFDLTQSCNDVLYFTVGYGR